MWLGGSDARDELSGIGEGIRVGEGEVEGREPIVDCLARATNAMTDVREVDTLGALNNTYGHQHFGVYAVVTKDGHVALGDQAQVL